MGEGVWIKTVAMEDQPERHEARKNGDVKPQKAGKCGCADIISVP